jgi:hypothetical protein
MYPVQQKCMHHMLKFLRRILQLDGREYAKIAMFDCTGIADEAAGVRTNWYSALQDLLSKVFWGQMIDSSTIDLPCCWQHIRQPSKTRSTRCGDATCTQSITNRYSELS